MALTHSVCSPLLLEYWSIAIKVHKRRTHTEGFQRTKLTRGSGSGRFIIMRLICAGLGIRRQTSLNPSSSDKFRPPSHLFTFLHRKWIFPKGNWPSLKVKEIYQFILIANNDAKVHYCPLPPSSPLYLSSVFNELPQHACLCVNTDRSSLKGIYLHIGPNKADHWSVHFNFPIFILISPTITLSSLARK